MNSKGLLLILVIANFCWAIEGTKTIEPVLVFEYKFDEPIRDVIFDTATMTVKEARALGMRGLEKRKATEKVRVQYPKVIITKKAVKFLDEKGRTERNIILNEKNMEWPIYNNKWERIVPLNSDNIVVTGNEGGYPFKEDSYLYIKWIDKKGETIKTEKKCLTSILSENEKYIVDGDLYEGNECVLYDINGNRLWRYFTEENLKEMHILYDGKVVIIEGVKEKKDKARISLIEINGKKLWEREIIKCEGGDYEIFSTVDCKIVVYGYVHKIEDEYILYGFDKNGNFLWQPKEYKMLPDSYNRWDYLSIPQNANILYGINKGYLCAMDINTGNILWQQKLTDFVVKVKSDWEPTKPISLYEVSLNGKYILLKGIFLLDGKTGKLLKEIEGLGGKFLSAEQIWKKGGNKIEIFSISDILIKGKD